jgi:hypothetical protein
MTGDLPVAVIGAGPVGLAAAAHLVRRGLLPAVLEQGTVGHALRDWGHVRVFTPWSLNVDAAARALLEGTAWSPPDPDRLPTGAEIVRDYLLPLAAHPAIAPHLREHARVLSVSREGLDKVRTAGRDGAPFVVRWRDADGRVGRLRARAVIDASGTWLSPSPMGVDGLPVDGEPHPEIAYGIPDVRGAERAAYAGRRVLVVGGGHSAINVVLDLLRLVEDGTRVVWALRRSGIQRLVGGGREDRLPARGALGIAARDAIGSGRLELLAPFAAERIEERADRLHITARLDGRPIALAVDRIVVATGARPDLGMLRELRVALDPVLEAPPALAPLIDPNVHSCGTVPPHGAAELAQPEPGLYVVGAKSYGRAPTFLLATGYEQVRSVAAEIAGARDEAREVRLVLPETGVCGVPAEHGCCAPTVPACCGRAA